MKKNKKDIGCNIELQASLNIPPTYSEQIAKMRESRQSDYGDPKDHCTRLATILSAAGFEFRGQPLKPEHVPLWFLFMKPLREANKHKDDNLDDIVGYVDVMWKCLK